jgi:glycosyltransferase involved in cell wall biosynthesis
VDSLLALADIAVFASVTEATPLSVLEAARAAKPVVATRVGALAEMVEDGSTGYLVEPRDATALASAVLRMLDTPGAVAAMGARARRLVERKFDIAKSARALEQLYASLAGLADRHPGG